MFQSLRQNSLIYIMHKGDPIKLEMGTVINTPQVKPKYLIPQAFGAPLEMVVDLQVRVNNLTVNYNGLPAAMDIADFYDAGQQIVISVSREAMNSEILNYKQKSIDALNSIEHHKSIIAGCDLILNSLNPEYAEKKQQQDEIISLKTQVSDVYKTLTDLTKLVETLTKTEVKNELNVGNTGE